jgi:hypothetical protein
MCKGQFSRIGITIGITALLGVVLRFTGNVNMEEVFGATAAFRCCRIGVHRKRQWQVNFWVMKMAWQADVNGKWRPQSEIGFSICL